MEGKHFECAVEISLQGMSSPPCSSIAQPDEDDDDIGYDENTDVSQEYTANSWSDVANEDSDLNETSIGCENTDFSRSLGDHGDLGLSPPLLAHEENNSGGEHSQDLEYRPNAIDPSLSLADKESASNHSTSNPGWLENNVGHNATGTRPKLYHYRPQQSHDEPDRVERKSRDRPMSHKSQLQFHKPTAEQVSKGEESSKPQFGTDLIITPAAALPLGSRPTGPKPRNNRLFDPQHHDYVSRDETNRSEVKTPSTAVPAANNQTPTTEQIANIQSAVPAPANHAPTAEQRDDDEESHQWEEVDVVELLRLGKAFDYQKMERLYNLQAQDPQRNRTYQIKKVSGDLIAYRRLSNVYTLGMHNKFFYPVWCAASDLPSQIGYIMFPPCRDLVCLRDALVHFTDKNMDKKQKQTKMRELLRMVAAPTALGLDALHCAVAHRRPTFFHRDLCIDNIFLPQDSFVNPDTGLYEPVYGEAKIKLTSHTRCSFDPESVETYASIQAARLSERYYHHPAPFTPSHEGEQPQYRKRHDWYSYGVLLLEVVTEMVSILVQPAKRSLVELAKDLMGHYKLNYYNSHINGVLNLLREDKFRDRISSLTARDFIFYLEVARDCLDMDKLNDGLVMEYFPIGFPEENEETYYFEYGLSQQSAKLLGFFDNSKNPSTKNLHDRKLERIRDEKRQRLQNENADENADEIEICQACMIRSSVKLPTRAYRRGVERRKDPAIRDTYMCSDTTCNRFYCHICYTNQERFFCPIQKHGTASSRIGHDSSYALIFCGDHWLDKQHRDVFVKDANHVYNTITHSMTCEMPEENVILCKLHEHSDGCGDTPLDRFLVAVKEMHRLIHLRQRRGDREPTYTDECNNDQNYCLLVFYSGHGKNENDETHEDGTWAPTQNGYIDHAVIEEALNSLTSCKSNPNCHDSSGMVTCVMDHCFTDEVELSRTRRKKPLTQKVIITTAPQLQSYISGEGSIDASEITLWFCRFLRSNFRCEMLKKKVDEAPCPACVQMTEHIGIECHSAYLDGTCLEVYHVAHLKRYGFRSKAYVNVKYGKDDPAILAHYHPEGVFFKLFPLIDDSGYSHVEVEFTFEINRENIEQAIKSSLENVTHSIAICLVTNHGSDDAPGYSLVWDSDIKQILELSSRTRDKKPVSPKLLYYHVVDEPVRICLAAYDENGTVMEDNLKLDLSEGDMQKLLHECQGVGQHSHLPNLLVHVVHKLYHLHYQPRLMRSASYNSQSSLYSNQPTDTEATETQKQTVPERVRNSFVGLLYEQPREDVRIDRYDEIAWRTVEEQASRYFVHPGREGRDMPFKFSNPPYFKISWKLLGTTDYDVTG